VLYVSVPASVADMLMFVKLFGLDWRAVFAVDQDNARRGDAYMNQIQSFAAHVPYMTCPGNHEQF